jgi:hypothetical protein
MRLSNSSEQQPHRLHGLKPVRLDSVGQLFPKRAARLLHGVSHIAAARDPRAPNAGVKLAPMDVDADRVIAGVAVLSLLLTGSVFAISLRDRRRRFAEPVTAWIERVEPFGGRRPFFELHLKNAGASAIYRPVVMTLADRVGEPHLGEWLFGTVGPGETAVRDIAVVDEEKGPSQASSFHIEVKFTDSAGRRWKRDRFGHLTRWGESGIPGSQTATRSLLRRLRLRRD